MNEKLGQPVEKSLIDQSKEVGAAIIAGAVESVRNARLRARKFGNEMLAALGVEE